MMNYELLNKQIESLIDPSDKLVSILSNLTSLLHYEGEYLWTGFYFVDSQQNELYLGPFQGPLACTKIPFNKGVCGKSWSEKKSLLVDDVHQFPGHIACSSKSNSEIVVPVIKEGEVVAVLDIDSENFSNFTPEDQAFLESVVQKISKYF